MARFWYYFSLVNNASKAKSFRESREIHILDYGANLNTKSRVCTIHYQACPNKCMDPNVPVLLLVFRTTPSLLSILDQAGKLCLPASLPWTLVGSVLWGQRKQIRVRKDLVRPVVSIVPHLALSLSSSLSSFEQVQPCPWVHRCPVASTPCCTFVNSPLREFTFELPYLGVAFVSCWDSPGRYPLSVESQLPCSYFTCWASAWGKKNHTPLPPHPHPTSKSCAEVYSCG